MKIHFRYILLNFLQQKKTTCNFTNRWTVGITSVNTKVQKKNFFRIKQISKILFNKNFGYVQTHRGINLPFYAAPSNSAMIELIFDKNQYTFSFSNMYSQLLNCLRVYKKKNSFNFYRLLIYYKENPNQKENIYARTKSIFDVYLISPYVYKTFLNRQYSWNNWYNRYIKFYSQFSKFNLFFQKKSLKYLYKFDDFIFKTKTFLLWEHYSLLIPLITESFFYKQLVVIFLLQLNFLFVDSFFHLEDFLSMKQISSTKNLLDEKKNQQKYFPVVTAQYKPFVYRSLKYGRKAVWNIFKEATYRGNVSYKLDKIDKRKFLELKNFSHLSGFSGNNQPVFEKWAQSNQNSFELWHNNVIERYSYSSFKKNVKLFPYRKTYSFPSMKNLLFYTLLLKEIQGSRKTSYIHMLGNLKKFRNFARSFFD